MFVALIAAVVALAPAGHGCVEHPQCLARVQARQRARRPMRTALASWYDDGGATASGRHYPMNFASLMFGSEWGRRVVFEHNGRWATGRLGDHGPYVSGRAFDLGPALKAALGCGDLCTVRYRA